MPPTAGGAPVGASGPPVGSSTTSVGLDPLSCATSLAIPASSLSKRICSPLGRTNTSRKAFETSIPMNIPLSLSLAPPAQPCDASFSLGQLFGLEERFMRRPKLLHGLYDRGVNGLPHESNI